jgi:hypothetical protein
LWLANIYKEWSVTVIEIECLLTVWIEDYN